jgi:hypothetical protein
MDEVTGLEAPISEDLGGGDTLKKGMIREDSN